MELLLPDFRLCCTQRIMLVVIIAVLAGASLWHHYRYLYYEQYIAYSMDKPKKIVPNKSK